MKIAILYDVLYPFSIGGGEKTNWELARRLAARGHDVTLVSSRMWEGSPYIDRDGVRCAGVCRWLQRTNRLGNRSILQPVLFAVGTFRFLRKERFDVVVCCAFPYLAALAAKLALTFTQTPLALMWFEARGFAAWIKQAGPVLGTFAAFFERCTRFLSPFNQANSLFTSERMIRLLGMRPDSISVIHCGVDYAQMTAAAAIHKERLILTVSRLVPHKRVDTLLEAFNSIAPEFPGHTLCIVGSGVEYVKLLNKVRETGLQDRVHFMECVSDEVLQNLFGIAEVFVLPSEQEGFGMVLIEAMAAGASVIARRSELSAAQYVIENGRDGLLFDDTGGLAETLRKVLSDGNLSSALIKAGKAKAASNDWDTSIVPEFERWLTELVYRKN